MSAEPRIAIVGLGGLFPGATTLDQFWRNVAGAVDCSREVPQGRWFLNPADAIRPGETFPDRVPHSRAYYLDAIPLDCTGLDMDEAWLRRLDPVFQLILHVGRQAFASAKMQTVNRTRIGVVLGHIALPTEQVSALARQYVGGQIESKTGIRISPNDPPDPLNRYVAGLPAGVLAKALGLGAGAYTLDAACASSLFALKLAADELRAGRADAMLTGGAARPDCLYTQMGFAQLRALSPTGRCSPFDAAGDGLSVGEGCGIFVLKRLDDAIRHGDAIHAVLASEGLSNDVEGNLLAPANEGQLRAMRAAYAAAGWNPGDVDLIECHATGTPVGDAVEFRSLQTLWRNEPAKPGRCVIGSVKSTVGHLLTGAGAAGLMKVLLALKHRTLPPTANFRQPSPQTEMEGSPFRVLTTAEPWIARRNDLPRRAAISGFGFGGINAHILLEEFQPADASVSKPTEPYEFSSKPQPIAIVGIDARFGRWQSLQAFAQRTFGAAEADASLQKNDWGVGSSTRGHFIDSLDVPLDQFRIPPKELEEMLPQQLLALQVAAAALADAPGWEARRERTGVFLGLGLDLNTTNFHLRWSVINAARRWRREQSDEIDDATFDRWLTELADAVHPALNANRTMGALGSIAASRVARQFQFGGPSFTICSEDTSSGSALNVAIRQLQSGQIDQALVGGVDLAGDVRSMAATQAVQTHACFGEGAAAVVLRRFYDAERDGDRIYAVLHGLGSAHGDITESGRAMQQAMQQATLETRWRPESILLHETPSRVQECIGHTGAASFVAGLVRAALALHHDLLPAEKSKQAAQFWLANRIDGPRRAAVSGDSIDGSCFCAMLEEHSPTKNRTDLVRPSPQRPDAVTVFGISAASPFGLSEQLDRLEKFAATTSANHFGLLARLWWNSCPCPAGDALAMAFVVSTPVQLREQLARARRHLSEKPDRPLSNEIYYSPAPLAKGESIAFVIPGSGNHFAGMGMALAARWPEVLRRQHKENARLRDQYSPETFWNADNLDQVDPRTAMFGQVTLGMLTCDLMQHFGVRPRASIGYSLGESAALFALRAWRDRDEMLQRMTESSLFVSDLAPPYDAARTLWNLPSHEPVDWVCGVVPCSAAQIRAHLSVQDRAYLLIVNSPNECVIGGRRNDVERLTRELRTTFLPLQAVTIAHCPAVMPVAAKYRNLHLLPTSPPDEVRFYSGAWGQTYELDRESAADAILGHALDTVDFAGLIERAWQDGIRIFVEMGPGASCTRMIGQTLAGRPHRTIALCTPRTNEIETFVNAVAQLFVERAPVDFTPLFDGKKDPPAPATKTVSIPVGRTPLRLPNRPTGRKHSLTHENEPQPLIVAANPSDIAGPLVAAAAATAAAHADYLRFAEAGTQQLERVLALQNAWLPSAINCLSEDDQIVGHASTTQSASVLFDRNQCQEIATGSISKLLGPEFAPVDGYPTRVRLPDGPLLLVDRIMALEGEARSLTQGRVVTEHDVSVGRWYLAEGHIPTSIAVESGQADLFLSGYLGIDFITKGLAVYRLLDAKVTFHRSLPGPCATIRYDIRIDRFFRQGETHLFRFRFEGAVDGEPLLTMTDGCAGFFTTEELAAGRGIVHTALDKRPIPGRKPNDWRELVTWNGIESYSAAQLDSLRAGDLAACFGPEFCDLSIADPLTLPGGMLKLVDRVVELDPTGGRYGLGRIRAEMDIHPDDWFLTCHFSDDQVMPGTLMYECCLHTMRVFLMRMGWIGETGHVRYEPIPGIGSQLKCRGQVIASTRTVMYEVSLKEFGYGPEPYAIADALMYADGKPIVEIIDMTLRMTGTTRAEMEATSSKIAPPLSPFRGEGSGVRGLASLFSRDRITAFAIGNPSDAFGERYRIFDHDRVIARLPGPPFQFLDRIVDIRNCEPWKLAAGGEIVAEYDVPANEWYFAANRQKTMPFAVLLEIALQPCGWLAAYLGSALTSATDLSFRNLGGKATQYSNVGPTIGTLTTAVKITKVSTSGGMIIQNYDFCVTCNGRKVYEGDTYFGFFSKAALAQQVGVRDAVLHAPTDAERRSSQSFEYPDSPPYPDRQLRMMDRIELFAADGGPKGLGFIRGSKVVDPNEWFFKAHFYQDPVWPGSLGLEAFLQLLKVVAGNRFRTNSNDTVQTLELGRPHTWSYRGQVIPMNRRVEVEAVITGIDEAARIIRADGFLSVDGKTIYEMKDFSLQG